MSRHEAIATINAALAKADDETVEAVAKYVRSVSAGPPSERAERSQPLTPRERELVLEGLADFEQGRVASNEEIEAAYKAYEKK